ncbi:MAG: hypothetical protein ACI4VW_03260 [Acutalibacteraceae bacterium]
MKKVLAIFLSALLICISLAPMSAAVVDPGIATRVMEGKYSNSSSGTDVVTKTTFTVAVTVPSVKKLTGVNLYVTFDPAVLAVKDAGLAGTLDAEDNFNPYFNGVAVNGYKTGTNNEYSFGWISNGGVSKTSARDIFYITFSVINTTKTETSYNVYVEEFRTDDGDDSNDVTSTLLVENKIVNFVFPDDVVPETTEDADSSSEDGETTAADINALLDLIRDMLKGNGVTFGDFADAIANLLGNAEITDIIEQLVDGNVDISELFQNILENLGLDFGSLEDLLNKIIEFLKNLFDGGEENPTKAPATTAAAAPNEETTAEGSSSGSEETGDVGIALAATVCLTASVAFVLTRKKKETV